MAKQRKRCEWCGDDPLYVAYHDEEWGVPVTNERQLFEFLVLEGAQAGLSWRTILYKRDAYREAFEGFEPERVARFGARQISRLMSNPGIVRNGKKIASAVANARAFLAVQQEFSGFAKYQWQFVEGRPLQSRYQSWKEIPAQSSESVAFSKDLKRRGFSFVGPTIMYAHMQAIGMVNDHVVTCFRRRELARVAREYTTP